jgi:hypothetical protein
MRCKALLRFDDTPRELIIELSADGSDYGTRGNFADEEFAAQWSVLEGLLRHADTKLSRQEIYAAWPAEERPDAGTVHRWLRRALQEGRLRQDGLGKCKDPFRYWLPETEERWRNDPLAWLRMPELRQLPSFGGK